MVNGQSETSVLRIVSPVRHWRSPGVLPFSNSSPFSSEAALQESCRASYPKKEEVKFRFVAQIHLAAPPGPGSAGLGLGGGTGGREGSAGSGALGSPSGSIVSWSTAQETEERNSLRGKQIV